MALDYLAHVRADGAAVLAALEVGTGAEPVTACPGWTLRDLVEHLGSVHRWVTEIVATGQRADAPDTAGVTDLAGWFAEGVDRLLQTLAGADPATPAWTFTTDRTV